MESESKPSERDESRSPDSSSDSDSDSDSDTGVGQASNSDSQANPEPEIKWLATTRERRSTAGNRMKSMLANEEPDSDLELLFAEDENDQGFTDVDDDGSDVHMDSSSDDEDNQNNADDDLEGEKELEKQAKERQAAQRKRKAQEAIPAKFRKKVRIGTTTPVTAAPVPAPKPAPRPKKKSERTSWLPSAADLPTRASSRSTTRWSKEQLHNQMVEREAKRLKQLAQMQKKAARLEALKKPPMTQEERLREAAIVEKRNSKSLNRWEVAEKQREEERRARLAALNERTLKGPVITFWSGIGEWMGRNMVVEEPAKKKREKVDKNKDKDKRKGKEKEKERAQDTEKGKDETTGAKAESKETAKEVGKDDGNNGTKQGSSAKDDNITKTKPESDQPPQQTPLPPSAEAASTIPADPAPKETDAKVPVKVEETSAKPIDAPAASSEAPTATSEAPAASKTEEPPRLMAMPPPPPPIASGLAAPAPPPAPSTSPPPNGLAVPTQTTTPPNGLAPPTQPSPPPNGLALPTQAAVPPHSLAPPAHPTPSNGLATPAPASSGLAAPTPPLPPSTSGLAAPAPAPTPSPVSLSSQRPVMTPSAGLTRSLEPKPSGVLAAPILAPPPGISVNGAPQPMLGFCSGNPKSNVLALPNTSQRPSPPTLSSMAAPGRLSPSLSRATPATSKPTLAPAPAPAPAPTPTSTSNPSPPQESHFQLIPDPLTALNSATAPITPAQPPEPPKPSTGARNAIVFQNFDENAIKDRTVQTQIIFGRKMTKLSKPSPAPLCVITNHPARYRDPKTGLPYYNAYAYREIRRLSRGEHRWSKVLNAWVGSGSVAARGVPERFLNPNIKKVVEEKVTDEKRDSDGKVGVEKKPEDEKAPETTPAGAGATPEAKPQVVKPAESKPAENQPAEGNKPAGDKPTEHNPAGLEAPVGTGPEAQVLGVKPQTPETLDVTMTDAGEKASEASLSGFKPQVIAPADQPPEASESTVASKPPPVVAETPTAGVTAPQRTLNPASATTTAAVPIDATK